MPTHTLRQAFRLRTIAVDIVVAVSIFFLLHRLMNLGRLEGIKTQMWVVVQL